MAYAFDQITGLLGEDDQNGKANIFNPQGQAQPSQDVGGERTPETKVDSGIAVTSGGSAAKTAQPQTAQATKSAITRANIGQVKAPEKVQQTLASIPQIEQGLKAQADKFVAGSSAEVAPVETKDLSQVSSFLQKTGPDLTFKYDPSSAYKTLDEGTINTAEDLKRMNQKTGRAYGGKAAQLDYGLLTRAPEWENITKALSGARQRIAETEGKAGEIEAAGEKSAAEQLAKAQGAVRGRLSGEVETVKGEVEKVKADLNAKISAIDLPAEQDRVVKSTIGEIAKENPALARYLSTLHPEQLNQFIRRPDQVAGDYVDAQKAARFNAILDILNSDERRLSSAAVPTDLGVKVDHQALRNALIKSATGKRQAAVNKATGRIEELTKLASERAGKRGGEIEEQKRTIKQRIIDGILPEYRDAVAKQLNIDEFLKGRNIAPEQAYTAGEIEELKQLYGVTGSVMPQYGAGYGAVFDPFDERAIAARAQAIQQGLMPNINPPTPIKDTRSIYERLSASPGTVVGETAGDLYKNTMSFLANKDPGPGVARAAKKLGIRR